MLDLLNRSLTLGFWNLTTQASYEDDDMLVPLYLYRLLQYG